VAIPFADLSARVNAAVFAHLSDAEGSVAGGATVSGLFTEAWEPAQSQGMSMGGTRPAWTVPDSAIPEDWERAPVIITAGRGVGGYALVEVHPLDGGMSTLVLERPLS
jgi:hypothetical protein